MKEDDYLKLNRESWNKRTSYHVASSFYDVKGFLAGKNTLNAVELNLLGDIRNTDVLHLQCHFGLDTLSLARLGARVTGVDLSDEAIKQAIRLSTETKLDANFICCDVYSLPQHLSKTFDFVFTSYGTIGWLPDLDKWAKVIARYLKPGGKFIFVDFHPVVWMYDGDFEKIAYSYFNSGAIVETESGTYAERDAPITGEVVGWNHNTAEVLTSLLDNGLVLESFGEYDYSPYNCFKNMTETERGRFRLMHLGNKLPLVFSLVVVKK